MPIVFRCDLCNKRYKVGDQHAGAQFQCPGCLNWSVVPMTNPRPVESAAKTANPSPTQGGFALEPPALDELEPVEAPARPSRQGVVPRPDATLSARCRECGALVASATAACPRCGFKPRPAGVREAQISPSRTSPAKARPTNAKPIKADWATRSWGDPVGTMITRFPITTARLIIVIVVATMSYFGSQWKTHGQSSQFSSDARQTADVAQEITYAPVFPDRPAQGEVTPDGKVVAYPMEITGTGRGLPMHIRLYLPAGSHANASLPCVFVAPAGTRMLYGSAIDDEDSPEHLPYAYAGFAVVAYELSGDVPDSHGPHVTFGQIAPGIRQFMDAEGGVDNARAAIDFVLHKVPEVNPARLYCAGHSSAGTVALDVAAADKRIRAVCAYAPCCDVTQRWGDDLPKLETVVPGVTDFAAQVSPINHASEFHCRVFVFHADDDQNVSTANVWAFLNALLAAGKPYGFSSVPTGGHYQSMIDEGIPRGIDFFKREGAFGLVQ